MQPDIRFVIDANYPVYPTRDWPREAEGRLIVTTEDRAIDNDHIQWRMIVTAEALAPLKEHMKRGNAIYTMLGTTSPPPSPPPLLWANTTAAWADLKARYGDEMTIDHFWTAQECCDYQYLYGLEYRKNDRWPTTTTPEPLQRAWDRWSTRAAYVVKRDDTWCLDQFNAMRLRFGMYPVDARRHEQFTITPLEEAE